MMGKNKYMVCVKCPTYNQSKFIKETLDGFCMQSTEFPFVCVIMDDASIDGEEEVIKTFLESNFILNGNYFKTEETVDYYKTFAQHKKNKNCFFAVYYLKYNHWNKKSKSPYFEDYNNQSKYLVTCEGDDYWTDPNKLNRQVFYMENHPEVALCYTKAKRKYGNKIYGYWGDEDCSFEGLIFGSIIPTVTRLVRKTSYMKYMEEVQPEGRGWKMGDYSNVLYYSLTSKIAYLDGCSGVYRVLEESSSHSKDIYKLISFYESADDVRMFFINEYIKDKEKREKLILGVKQKSVLYKLKLYTDHFMIDEASKLYKENIQFLPKNEKIEFNLKTFSRIISPVIIVIYNARKYIKKVFKWILVKIYNYDKINN